jgi:outer membrane protein
MPEKTMRLPFVAAALAVLLHAVPARAEVKVEVVDLQRALNEVDEGRSAKEKLRAEFEQKQRSLDEKKGQFDKLRADLEKQASVLSEQARRERAEELDHRAQELQQTFVQLQQELSVRERDMTRGIFDKMAAIVREIAERDGASVVLDRSTVAYAQESLDITNELVRTYNARHKVAGSAPAAAKKTADAGKKPEAKATPKPAAAKAGN